jgi:polyketide biosynthesis enoyl-CoA hydratase PksH
MNGVKMPAMIPQTVNVRHEDNVCFLQLHRPQANNTINRLVIEECLATVEQCRASSTVLVVEGLPDVFCLGADFVDLTMPRQASRLQNGESDAELLYKLWLQFVTGPFITMAHVRARANAGGVGFAAACDIVVASTDAQFSLSEMLFGLFPACVLPFLIRRVGVQRAHYLTLTTKPITVQEAHSWGLVDAFGADSEKLLRVHLRRLRCLNKRAIRDYKSFAAKFNSQLAEFQPEAVRANHKMFSDPENLDAIERYVTTGQLPWES